MGPRNPYFRRFPHDSRVENHILRCPHNILLQDLQRLLNANLLSYPSVLKYTYCVTWCRAPELQKRVRVEHLRNYLTQDKFDENTIKPVNRI